MLFDTCEISSQTCIEFNSIIKLLCHSIISNKTKQEFFQVKAVSVLLLIEKSRWNHIRIMRATLSNSWKQCSTKCIPTATYHPFHKPLKKGNPDMLGSAREVKTNSLVTFFNGLLHTDTPVLTDRQKLSFVSSVHTLCACWGPTRSESR